MARGKTGPKMQPTIINRDAVYRYIGNRIRTARLEKRYLQAQLGKLLRVTHVAISDIERGRTKPDVAVLMEIGFALEVTLEQFLGPELYDVGLPPIERLDALMRPHDWSYAALAQ